MATHAVKTCSACGREYDARAIFCPYDGAYLTAVTVPELVLPEGHVDGAPAVGGAFPESEDLLLGRLIERRYKLLERVGRGGMGTVYRAVHIELNRPVAIKILNFDLIDDPIAVRRFRREAEALGAISHPNAVSVSDFGVTAEGLAYIVMELLEGVSLRNVVVRESPLPLARAVNIIRQICGAVTAAHQVGIIHRDLKPDNIMLVGGGTGDETAKVLDFGIARLIHVTGRLTSRLTARDVVLGTPRYMSPEACEGRELSPATDVYSLGIILYEMLAGDVPFDGNTALDVALQHVNDPPPPLGRFRDDLPAGVEAVVMRALEKEPESRPAPAIELAEQLEAAATGAVRSAARATSPVFPTPTPAARRAATRDEGVAGGKTTARGAVERGGPPRRTVDFSAGAVIGLLALGALLGIALVALIVYFVGPSGARAGTENRERVIDVSLAAPPGMVFVPGGAFTMGEDGWAGPRTRSDEMNRPAHGEWTDAFFVDASEVTNEEYAQFLDATDYAAPDGWRRARDAADWERLPVTRVSWFDAAAYAQWADKRLPTEIEWEKAARGVDGRAYPWGDAWDAARAVSAELGVDGPQPVGSRPDGASPYQAVDMSGNVYEWTASDFAPYGDETPHPEPNRLLKVIRGGSYSSQPPWLRASFRVWIDPRSKHPNLGFRCVRPIDRPAN